jgi:hypothetical protein
VSFKTVKIAQAGVPVLRILDDKGDAISVDVYGLEVIVWNTGDLSLGTSSDRIRKPLVISIKGASKILGAVVQDARNVDVSDIAATVDVEQKIVSINWRQFDPSDAIKVFIIYSGQTQSPIDYSARFIGAHLTSASEYKETDPETTGLSKFYYGTMYDWENRKLKLILSVSAVLLQLTALGIMFFTFRTKTKTRSAWIPALMIISMMCMLLSSTSVLSPKIPF